MHLLPWILFVTLDGGTLVETLMHYATYKECMAEGRMLSNALKEDMHMTGPYLEPVCKRIP